MLLFKFLSRADTHSVIAIPLDFGKIVGSWQYLALSFASFACSRESLVLMF